jgi:hemerythrin-like metal-binding protein
MRKVPLAPGCFCVEIPEAGLTLLCASPENAVKFLTKAGCIRTVKTDGWVHDVGPNAILLSEVPVQNGAFSNVAEFPILHMLYIQGMLVPGHPNNSGRRPLIIGLEDQVEAQSRYIFAGNYGLSTLAEMEAGGLDPASARKHLRMKLAFAFGKIRPTEELLDLRTIDNDALLLAPGVFLTRKAQNVYEFLAPSGSVEVDLNLKPGESYGAPYRLPPRPLETGAFSVVHLGDGDGWDSQRPCTGSLLVCGSEMSLVDAGPNLAEGLTALGVETGRIRRLFHTHGHDDHFVGLTTLMRSERRVLYHAVPWVRASVEKKFAALTGLTPGDFGRYFEVHDLVLDQWNRCGGVEVMPLFSPHPVETTVFHFRVADGQGGYRTYAHLADIAAFDVLDGMTQDDPSLPGLSIVDVSRVKADYLRPADLKKIDIGGGMIHGAAADFAADTSGTVLLSHTGRALTEAELRVGRRPEFGEVSTLVAGAAGDAASTADGGVPDLRAFFRTVLFPGDRVSDEAVDRLVRASREWTLAPGPQPLPETPGIGLVVSGSLVLTWGGGYVDRAGPGTVVGEESLLSGALRPLGIRSDGPVRLRVVAREEVEACPLLLWNLSERASRRRKAVETLFRFDWREEYSVGVGTLDAQHRRLFELISEVGQDVASGASLEALLHRLHILTHYADFHFKTEQDLMGRFGWSNLGPHRGEHEKLAEGIRRCASDLRDRGLPPGHDLLEFLKTWLLRHTLLEDRRYIPFFHENGLD